MPNVTNPPLDTTSKWTITAQATAAQATLTRNGVPGQKHYVTSIHGGYGASQVGNMTLSSVTPPPAGSPAGTNPTVNTVGNYPVNGTRDCVFAHALEFAPGDGVQLQLGAGGAGVVGYLTVSGYTA